MTTAEQLQLGRGKNAVLAYFQSRLSVPKIYLTAIWNGLEIDVLAMDRDATGDIHVVLLFPSKYFADPDKPDIASQMRQEQTLVERLSLVPAHYKYICALEMNADRVGYKVSQTPSPMFLQTSFHPDGVGRIGYLSVDIAADGPFDIAAETKVLVKPERFRAAVFKLAIDYVQQHPADWELREWLPAETAIL